MPTDWQRWLFLRKDSAERNDLWQYLDPSLSEEHVRKIEQEKLQEKEVWGFHAGAQPEAQEEIPILDLIEKEAARYVLWLKAYTRKGAQRSKKQKVLREFNHEISRTIESRHISLISDCSSPYERLGALKKHLCPSSSEKNYQLRAHYQRLLHTPKSSNLDSWFEDWLETTSLMKEAALPEVTGNRAQEDFIRAVRSLDESWSTCQLTELVRKDQTEAEFTGISDLVAEYRSYYRRIRPIASSLRSFATLEIARESQVEQQDKRAQAQNASSKSSSGQGKQATTCLCGKQHKFQDCLYVNQTLRKPGWQPDPHRLSRDLMI